MMPWNRYGKKASVASVYVFLTFVTVAMMAPLLWSAITSIKPEREIYRTPIRILPSRVSWEHYVRVLRQMPDVAWYFKNSVVVTVVSVTAVVILATLAGYAFGRLKFAGKDALFSFILIALTIPYAIYVIPVFMTENALGLLNTNLGLILPNIGLNLPLAIFIMRGTFRVIPSELEEAARIDGCTMLGIWYRVMLPLAGSGLAAVTILTFISVWEEFLFAVTLMPDARFQTLPVGIKFLKDEAQSWAYGVLSTTIVLYIIPVALVFLLLQRYFVKGMMEGALKG